MKPSAENEMTDQIREQLSALLDGELPPDEMGLLMRRLDKDPGLRRTFGSYALIGETLRAPGGRIASPSFAACVSAALDEAPVLVEKASAARPGAMVQARQHVALWKRPMVRTALASVRPEIIFGDIGPVAGRDLLLATLEEEGGARGIAVEDAVAAGVRAGLSAREARAALEELLAAGECYQPASGMVKLI